LDWLVLMVVLVFLSCGGGVGLACALLFKCGVARSGGVGYYIIMCGDFLVVALSIPLSDWVVVRNDVSHLSTNVHVEHSNVGVVSCAWFRCYSSSCLTLLPYIIHLITAQVDRVVSLRSYEHVTCLVLLHSEANNQHQISTLTHKLLPITASNWQQGLAT